MTPTFFVPINALSFSFFLVLWGKSMVVIGLAYQGKDICV